MRRPRAVISVAVVLVALVAIVAVALAAGGGDDEEATKSPAPRGETTGESPPPPNLPSGLPPEFVQCMADQGFEIESPADIHSAPPQVLEACFGTLHQGDS
jgi:hypothetical protein